MKNLNLTKKTIGLAAAVLIGTFVIGMGASRATQPPDSITVDEAVSIALKDAGRAPEEVTVTKQRPDIEDGVNTYDIEFFWFESDSSVTEYDYEIDAATGRILERSRETEYVTRTPQKPDPRNTDAANSGTTQSGNAASGGSTQTSADTPADGATTTQPAQPAPQPVQPAPQPVQPAPQPVQPAPQQPAQTSQQYIGVEQAKSAALAHAGVGASDAYFTKEKQDFDDGRVVYEIDFYVGYVEYEYEIDAVSGQIIDFDYDYDD